MKKIITMVSALLLAIYAFPVNAEQHVQQRQMQQNPTQSDGISTFANAGDYAYVSACLIEYETTTAGVFIIGGANSSGLMKCTLLNGKTVAIPVEKMEVKVGPQLGYAVRTGWLLSTAVGFAGTPENWSAVTLGVSAEAGLGPSVAVGFDAMIDNSGKAGLGIKVEVGYGIIAGLTVNFGYWGQVEESPDTD